MKKYSCDFSLNVGTLVEEANQQAKNQNIDSLDNLKNHKIYLFSGTKDTTVDPCVMKKLQVRARESSTFLAPFYFCC
jgi:hypothetical protein